MPSFLRKKAEISLLLKGASRALSSTAVNIICTNQLFEVLCLLSAKESGDFFAYLKGRRGRRPLQYRDNVCVNNNKWKKPAIRGSLPTFFLKESRGKNIPVSDGDIKLFLFIILRLQGE